MGFGINRRPSHAPGLGIAGEGGEERESLTHCESFWCLSSRFTHFVALDDCRAASLTSLPLVFVDRAEPRRMCDSHTRGVRGFKLPLFANVCHNSAEVFDRPTQACVVRSFYSLFYLRSSVSHLPRQLFAPRHFLVRNASCSRVSQGKVRHFVIESFYGPIFLSN